MRNAVACAVLAAFSMCSAPACAADSFQMMQPVQGTGTPSVIGGEPVDPASYPATFIFQSNIGGCTSTAVGAKAILTAAHCVENGSTGEVTLKDDTKLKVTCEHHPHYSINRTKDFALCSTSQPMKGFPFEVINTSIAYPAVGDTIRLLGYGCREKGGFDRTFGVLFTGLARISVIPEKDANIDTVAVGGAALCSGDSGGGAYVERAGGRRSYFAVNSRGDINSFSYLSTTATPAFIKFAQAWAAKNDASLCGVNPTAEGCRP